MDPTVRTAKGPPLREKAVLSVNVSAAQLISTARHYSSMLGLLSIHLSPSPSRQPSERLARLPSLTGTIM